MKRVKILNEHLFVKFERAVNMERTVLHCDLDNFFASVECVYEPSLAKVPFAVCGDPKERHGIVLAKNQLAKQFGIKTAVPIWQALQLCPSLRLVEPHYDRYMDYSRKARNIYEYYTDMVEAFGIDECWLDVTGSQMLFGSGEQIAKEINSRIKQELGLTVSVGVSFNKCFAKLGSDLNKPDGISIISRDNFKSTVWPLPVDNLLWVGKSTKTRLNNMGVLTIGDIAAFGRNLITASFGKNGESLWRNAMGYDYSPVLREKELPAAKSIGKSVTGSRDLVTEEEIFTTFLALAENVSEKLRKCSLLCGTVQIHIRDTYLGITEHQTRLVQPTRLASELAQTGMELFKKNWRRRIPVRSIGIRACELMCDCESVQLSFEYDYQKALLLERLETSVDRIREKYGKNALVRASLMHSSLNRNERISFLP